MARAYLNIYVGERPAGNKVIRRRRRENQISAAAVIQSSSIAWTRMRPERRSQISHRPAPPASSLAPQKWWGDQIRLGVVCGSNYACCLQSSLGVPEPRELVDGSGYLNVIRELPSPPFGENGTVFGRDSPSLFRAVIENGKRHPFTTLFPWIRSEIPSPRIQQGYRQMRWYEPSHNFGLQS